MAEPTLSTKVGVMSGDIPVKPIVDQLQIKLMGSVSVQPSTPEIRAV